MVFPFRVTETVPVAPAGPPGSTSRRARVLALGGLCPGPGPVATGPVATGPVEVAA